MQLSKGKVVLVLAAVVLLLAATPSFAQVVFNASSLPRNVRCEGQTEVIGEVVLQAANAGTVIAGSSINVTLPAGANITNTPGPTNVTCTAAGCAPTASFSGSSFTISFPVNQAFAVSDRIVVSGVRVNVAALGTAVNSINAALTGVSSAPATNPVTFNQTSVPVANVLCPATTVSVTQAQTFQTCQNVTAAAAPAATNARISVKENFVSAFTSLVDEQTFSTTTVATAGTQIELTISGVPSGYTIGALDLTTSTAGLTFGAVTRTPATGTTAGSVVYNIPITATNLAALETAVLEIPISGSSNNTPVGGAVSVTGTVKLVPIGGTGIIRFAENTQGAKTIATIGDCVTNLLFPWIVNTAGFDTGIAIANTTKDDALGANGTAAEQAGTCKLTALAAADGSTSGTFTTTSIVAGGTGTVLASAAFPGFAGHVFAVCNFLDAHAFAFITDGFGAATPNVAQGYLALIIPSGSVRTAAAGESLGQ